MISLTLFIPTFELKHLDFFKYLFYLGLFDRNAFGYMVRKQLCR